MKKIKAPRTEEIINRASQSGVLNSGQKMALVAFYFIRTLTKALTYYYMNRSQRHLLVAFENNLLKLERNVRTVLQLHYSKTKDRKKFLPVIAPRFICINPSALL